MPVQRTVLGRPLMMRLPPRRFQVVLGFAFFFAISILLFGNNVPVDVPAVNAVTDRLPQALVNPHLPQLPHAISLFRPAAHKPPEQANSSIGGTRWHIDWRWKNPFSSTVTLDEDRAVLPPLKQRPAVYTYYEPNAKDSKAIHDAEERLLLQWRRAWWAQGFKPVVLGRGDAMNNPLYTRIERMQIGPHMEFELARWLAWSNMGSGILATWLAYPMAQHDNALLSFLRRGQFPQLTRFDGLGSGLFCGEKDAVTNAIKTAIEHPDLGEAKSMADKALDNIFRIDKDHDGIAFYDTAVIEKKYKTVAKALSSPERHEGLALLADLINAHLQVIWQNGFSSGIAVVKPMAEHMTSLADPAMDIATNLTECPRSPELTTCPPNQPKCKKCISAQPLAITTPPTFQNKSNTFYIGVVPHPYTTISLVAHTTNVDISLVRRPGMQSRDAWLYEVTKDLVGTGPSSQARIVTFKEAVASEYGATRSLWLTAEKESTQDLDWIFGFDVWHDGIELRDSEPPVPGPERRPPKPKPKGPVLDEDDLNAERKRLQKARELIKADGKQQARIRDAVEAWNMADTEAWKFARAFAARRVMERSKFEEEERGFHGAEHRGSRWGRWFD